MDFSKKPGNSINKIGQLLNNEKAVISIITPFYNGGKTLMETANSVFSQTYPFFEWIIVDDGSKDSDSLKKLKDLEKIDNRVKIFHKENGGPSIARDFGISKACKTSKYIFFLDCDDIIDHTMLECLYWTLETHKDASFAYTTMVNFGDREFLWEQYLTSEREKEENVICISSMVKKDDLIEVGGFGIKEKAMYEDWNLWLKLLEKGKKPIRVNAPLFWYRVSDSGEFSRANKNKKQAMKYVNETASRVDDDVEVIQFPREGDRYSRVQEYPKIVLPKYKKKNKIKVLFIFPWMVVGGADYFNRDLIKKLDKNKYEAIVVTTTPNNNVIRQELEEAATEIYDMASFLERSDYINFVDYLISSRNVDAVFVSNTQYGYYMIPYLKQKYSNVAFMDYIHSIDMKDPREGFGRCTIDVDNYLTKTYCCNNFTKKQLENRYNKKKVETIYIGTDDKLFDPKKYDKDKLKNEYNIPDDKTVISFIARLSEEKRPTMFIEIGKRLLKDNPNLYFVIAGDGPLMNEVSSKVTDDFKLLGMCNESAEVYVISDLTVNCSSLEGLALTSYESLSMGVPVVSTDVGGQTELIDESVGGIVHFNEFPTEKEYYDEINNYCNEIKRVISNLDSIKNNCRKRIQNGFSLDLMIKKVSKEIENNINIEKNKKYEINLENNYIIYELALEALHTSYYHYCKNYIENKFDIIYSRNKKPINRNKIYYIKKRYSKLLNRIHAKEEAKIILNLFRTIYQIIINFVYSIKFFLLSIPAFFKLLYKFIFRNK